MTDKDTQAQRKLLEDFVLYNEDLERLEALISEFNIFDAVGMAHHETRHSNFLAFLLNPLERHGLGDRFLKRFLMRALIDAGEAAISPIEIDVIDLSNAVVERETDHIDILIYNLSNRLVCLVENKVYSGEHDNQLARYMNAVRQRFRDSSLRVVPIYLTPDGDRASDERFLALSYRAVLEEIEYLRHANASTIGPDVNTALHHYVVMLGRHVVSDSEIARLSQQIYRRHKAAIDLIIEHMPDTRAMISDYLVGLVKQEPGLELAGSSKTRVRFYPAAWDDIAAINTGTGWANSSKIVAFEFTVAPEQLILYLFVGPGDPSARQMLHAWAKSNPRVFPGCRSTLSPQWTVLSRFNILSRQDYADSSFDNLKAKIDTRWQQFTKRMLPDINEHLVSVGQAWASDRKDTSLTHSME